MSKAYKLSNEQIIAIARLCYQEQGTAIGAAAEASLACNLYEKHSSNFSSVYDYMRNSGWFANAAHYMDYGRCTGDVLSAVIDVLNGNRTLPEYVDEHDCFTDIVSISTGANVYDKSAYIKDVTKIRNTYGAVYTFYCFPDNTSDPFGYTSKPISEQKDGNTMIEKAISQMETWANDNSHGYDQIYRWGERGDYDCSSAIIQAWENANVPVKSQGATYTGNMKKVFLKCGFKDVTSQVNLANGSGLKRGDVLLNEANHTAMYCGNGKEVEASINERGTATGGQPGDQTGREFLIRPYYNYPWDCVLRFVGGGATSFTSTPSVKIPLTVEEIKLGDKCQSVWILRTLLRGRGYRTKQNILLKRSRVFDANTDYCVKKFQAKNNLDVDGIVGKNTWAKLTGIN